MVRRPAIPRRRPKGARPPNGSLVSEQAQPGPSGGSPAGSDAVSVTRSPGFWVIMRYAALFGVVLAFAALAYLGLVKGGTNLWFTLPKNPGWLDGSLWWVAVTAGAGVLVGVLRRAFRLPVKLPGLVRELKAHHVEPPPCPGGSPSHWCRSSGGRASGPRPGWE